MSLSAARASAGVTFYVWMRESAKAEREQNTASVFYLSWPEGAEPEFFHRLVPRARSIFKAHFEAAMHSEVMPISEGGGVETTILKDGEVQYGKREDYQYLKDMGLLAPGEDEFARDEFGQKIIATVRMPAPAHQKIHVSRELLPETYGDHRTAQADSLAKAARFSVANDRRQCRRSSR